MIKVLDKNTKGGITLNDPSNLSPVVFKCKDCGCTIRKIEETNSYILMSIPKDVELGLKKICPYCYNLKNLRGSI